MEVGQLLKNKNKMFFSIIIPAIIDQRNFLFFKECLNSIYLQNFDKLKYEILIVENGSKYNLKSFIKKIKNKFKNLTLINSKKKLGPGIARNFGLSKAKGKYIIFLDCDDLLPKNTLKRYHSILKDNTYDTIVSNWSFTQSNKLRRKDFKYFKNGKDYLIKKFISMNFNGSIIFHCFKKKLFKKNNIKFSSGVHEDLPVIFKIYYFSKKIYLNNIKMYTKRKFKGSITNSFNKERIFGYIKSWNIIKRFIISKKGRIYFEENLKYFYAKGIIGLIAIMIMQNDKLNKNLTKKREIYKLLAKYIKKNYKKVLGDDKISFSSNYDMITKNFLNYMQINKNNLNFKDYKVSY